MQAENQFSIIDAKINELIENIEKFENETKSITQQHYTTVQKDNTQLIKEIEDYLNKAMIQTDEEARTTILRYQKAVAGWRKKLNQLLQAKKSFIEVAANVDESEYGDEEEETDMLLQDMKIETYEEYIKEREKKIRGIHKDMGIIHQIIQGMGQLAQKQSEDIEVMVDDIKETENHTEKANKDLVATAKTKDAKPKRYYKLILSLVIVILISIYMIQKKIQNDF